GEEEGERGDGGLKYCVLGRERPHLLGGLRPRSRRSQYLREGFPHRRSRVEQTTQGWCGRSPAQRRQSSPRARRRPRYACCSSPGIGTGDGCDRPLPSVDVVQLPILSQVLFCPRLDTSALVRQCRLPEYGQAIWHGTKTEGMARPLHRLTARWVETAKTPGLYAGGGSLYLLIAPVGSKQYIFRYIRNGRLHDMGIGPTHPLSLAEARERATEARKLLLDGIDPVAAKRARFAALRAADAKAITFKQCVEGFIRDNESSWTNRMIGIADECFGPRYSQVAVTLPGTSLETVRDQDSQGQ